MADGIRVTPDQLVTLGGMVSRVAGDIANQSGGLGQHISGVVGGQWMSSASTQFHHLWEDWQAGATRLNEALVALSKLLIDAGNEYAETERRLTSRLAMRF